MGSYLSLVWPLMPPNARAVLSTERVLASACQNVHDACSVPHCLRGVAVGGRRVGIARTGARVEIAGGR